MSEQIKSIVDEFLPIADGFESHVFRVGEYNKQVGDAFKLDYHPAAMGLIILSTPDMFDVAFKQWILDQLMNIGTFYQLEKELESPIQKFLEFRIQTLVERLKEQNIEHDVIHDYSMTPQRRPRILMQTCGHVAGAAYYYQPKNYSYVSEGKVWPLPNSMGPNLKFIGLSLHPVYGGHFAFRTVLIFPNILLNDFKENVPQKILTDDDEIRNALDKFNYNWKDSNFRDFGQPSKRYSDLQKKYFEKPVAERWTVLRWLINGNSNEKSPFSQKMFMF